MSGRKQLRSSQVGAQPITSSATAGPQTRGRIRSSVNIAPTSQLRASRTLDEEIRIPASHPLEGTFTQDDNQSDEEPGEVGNSGVPSKKKRARGASKGTNLAPKNGKHLIEYNKDGKPVGNTAKKLTRRIGDYVRDPSIMPIDCSWKEVPDSALEELWQRIWNEYDFQGNPKMKSYVFEKAQIARKGYRNYLKRECWEKFEGEELLERIEGRVEPGQWDNLIKHWNTPEHMAKAETGSNNRVCNEMNHHLGSITMAQKALDMTNDGIEPEEIDVYIAAYTAKDQTKFPRTAKIVDKIKEARNTQQATQGNCSLQPILTEVLGDNKGKYIRGKGNHTKKKDVDTSAGRYEKEALNELIKQNQELRHTFRGEIEAREQRRDAEFKEEMQEVRGILSVLCRALNVPLPNQSSRLEDNVSASRRLGSNEDLAGTSQ